MSTSLSFITLIWLVACLLFSSTSSHTQDPLTNALVSSNGLIKTFSSSNISDLEDNIGRTPCLLFYSYASWSSHARAFIYKLQALQRVAELYEVEISQGCLLVAAAELNQPLEEGHWVWSLIRDGAYWSSISMFSTSQQRTIFFDPYEWGDMDAYIKGCLRLAECNMESASEIKDDTVHIEL